MPLDSASSGAVEHLGDRPVDLDRLGVGSGSAPCSRDSSISSLTSRPSRADSWWIRSAKRRDRPPRVVGALGGVEQRLGEQLQRADRGLELVADVGDEVAAHPGQPVRLGDVGGLDRDGDEHSRDRADDKRGEERMMAYAESTPRS
jgi:hypothetical protein